MTDEIGLPENAAPPAPGDIDEFAGIEPPRRMRSPIVAVLGALLAGYLLFHLRVDFSYWMHNSSPQDLGDARGAAAALPGGNRYVTVRGAPDRTNAAMLDTRGKDEFRQFFRLLGTDTRFLVLRTYGSLPNARTVEDRFTGRLLAFHDLSFADSIREWFRTRVTATHFFAPAALRERLGARETDLLDLAGDRVHLGPDARLALDFAFPDQYRLALPRDRFLTAEAAAAALAKLGFQAPAPAALPVKLPDPAGFFLFVGRPQPVRRDPVMETVRGLDPQATAAPDPTDPAAVYVAIPKKVYTEGEAQARRALEALGLEGATPPPRIFVATLAPARRDATLEALRKLDPNIEVTLRTETHERPFAALAADRSLDLAHLARAKLIEPLVIPDDAKVLVEADAPSSYWYVPLVCLLLLLFLVFNLLALRAALPRRRHAPAPARSGA